MSHLVPNPPPANYQVPTLTKFSVAAADGVGKILAWGVNDPTRQWRVGTDVDDQVVSYASPSPYPDLTFFELRGVRKGMKLAIFVYQGGKWIRYSQYVEVEYNLGDTYAALFAAGNLPKSRHCGRISFYPFGAQQAYQPLTEEDWKDKVEAALGKINSNVIGRAVLQSIKKDVTIYPYLPWYSNAWSDVRINPKQWEGDFRPGAGVDEILLHELIHVVENNAGPYQDRWGFQFDKADFLTVNATNVYSCMLGRALRKDHSELALLPEEHFRNPELHWDQQKPNYLAASQTAISVVKAAAGVQGVWNPFRYWATYWAATSIGP